MNTRIAKPDEWLFDSAHCEFCKEETPLDKLVLLEQVDGETKYIVTKLCLNCSTTIAKSLLDAVATRMLNVHYEEKP